MRDPIVVASRALSNARATRRRGDVRFGADTRQSRAGIRSRDCTGRGGGGGGGAEIKILEKRARCDAARAGPAVAYFPRGPMVEASRRAFVAAGTPDSLSGVALYFGKPDV